MAYKEAWAQSQNSEPPPAWLAPWYNAPLPHMAKPTPPPDNGSEYVDPSARGTLRGTLQAQRKGSSRYGAIPEAVAKDPAGIAALVAAGVLAPELLSLPLPVVGGTTLSNAALMGGGRLAGKAGQWGAKELGAPGVVQDVAANAAAAATFTRGGWLQRAGQVGLQTGGGMGGEWGGRQVGLPEVPGLGNVGGIAGGLGADRAAGKWGFNPTQQQIINPEDKRVYHGTSSPVPFEMPRPEFAGTNFGAISAPGAVYYTQNPDFASRLGHAVGDVATPGARVYPLTLKKGANLFDPSQDPWPEGYEALYERFLNDNRPPTGDDWSGPLNETETASFLDRFSAEADQLKIRGADPNAPEMPRPDSPEWWEYTQWGTKRRNQFIEDLKKRGYQGTWTPFEGTAFTQDVLEPAYPGGVYDPMPQTDLKGNAGFTAEDFDPYYSYEGPEVAGIKDNQFKEEGLSALTPEERAELKAMPEFNNNFSEEIKALETLLAQFKKAQKKPNILGKLLKKKGA